MLEELLPAQSLLWTLLSIGLFSLLAVAWLAGGPDVRTPGVHMSGCQDIRVARFHNGQSPRYSQEVTLYERMYLSEYLRIYCT